MGEIFAFINHERWYKIGWGTIRERKGMNKK